MAMFYICNGNTLHVVSNLRALTFLRNIHITRLRNIQNIILSEQSKIIYQDKTVARYWIYDFNKIHFLGKKIEQYRY